MSKYPLDRELSLISKVSMPGNPALLPIANRVIGLSRCASDEKVTVTRLRVPGYGGFPVNTLVIEPASHEGPLPCMVLLHGGGFMMKASFAHHYMAKWYASGLPCRVVYPDYRLAPENPFPFPAEDCFRVYQWAVENMAEGPVIISGDSAGGNLALAVTLMARDRGLRPPDASLLIYPVTDRRMTTQSMKKYVDTPVFNAKLAGIMWEQYLGDRKPAKMEYASPLEAPSFEGMPPTYIEVAEFDALRDEGILLHEKLREQGIPSELHEVKGACHGFEVAFRSSMVKTCMARRLGWLRNSIGSRMPPEREQKS